MITKKLTHVDGEGQIQMVDVGSKSVTTREAVATGRVVMQPETLALIQSNQIKKGVLFMKRFLLVSLILTVLVSACGTTELPGESRKKDLVVTIYKSPT